MQTRRGVVTQADSPPRGTGDSNQPYRPPAVLCQQGPSFMLRWRLRVDTYYSRVTLVARSHGSQSPTVLPTAWLRVVPSTCCCCSIICLVSRIGPHGLCSMLYLLLHAMPSAPCYALSVALAPVPSATAVAATFSAWRAMFRRVRSTAASASARAARASACMARASACATRASASVAVACASVSEALVPASVLAGSPSTRRAVAVECVCPFSREAAWRGMAVADRGRVLPVVRDRDAATRAGDRAAAVRAGLRVVLPAVAAAERSILRLAARPLAAKPLPRWRLRLLFADCASAGPSPSSPSSSVSSL